MKTVWKFPIDTPRDIFSMVMPKGAETLTVQTQGSRPCIWALVDPMKEDEERHFEIHGTGHSIYPVNNLKYINTFQMEEGSLVFHLFERA